MSSVANGLYSCFPLPQHALFINSWSFYIYPSGISWVTFKTEAQYTPEIHFSILSHEELEYLAHRSHFNSSNVNICLCVSLLPYLHVCVNVYMCTLRYRHTHTWALHRNLGWYYLMTSSLETSASALSTLPTLRVQHILWKHQPQPSWRQREFLTLDSGTCLSISPLPTCPLTSPHFFVYSWWAYPRRMCGKIERILALEWDAHRLKSFPAV